MQCVEHMIIKLFAHAYRLMSGGHQIAGRNVLWILIVQQHWLVFAINARAHVMEHVDQMLTAPFSIIRRIVFVMMDFWAIHTVDAVNLLSVSKMSQM